MTAMLTIVAFLAASSLVLGLYFRIAEYDVLASDKVWERIVPLSTKIVNDESVPDEIAGDVAVFSYMTGCGCFVNAILLSSILEKMPFTKEVEPDLGFEEAFLGLSDELRHDLFELLSDLILFDSLHAPILGRLCRVLHRNKFSKRIYRPDLVDPALEQSTVIRIARVAENVIEAKRPTPLMAHAV